MRMREMLEKNAGTTGPTVYHTIKHTPYSARWKNYTMMRMYGASRQKAYRVAFLGGRS